MSDSVPEPPVRPTIVGVATGVPDGGLAVLRLSGSRAVEVAEACLASGLPEARQLRRRRVMPPRVSGQAPAGGEDALVVWMPGPRSFTGEDVVELHVHGGRRNVEQLVGWLLAAGAEPAGPGDFTRRAFELGKLSLDQAEGIAAVIGAQTDVALAHARKLVAGELREQVEALRAELMALRLDVEGAIGFPDDVDASESEQWARRARDIASTLHGWLARFEAGRRARARARIVLSGPPNAGKSALFNALLGRRRSIVADVAGTTRDFIEAELEFGSHGATLVDTAGLRATDDAVEAAGVAWSREQLEGADLVLWLRASDDDDGAADEALDAPPGCLCVETKRDLGRRRAAWAGVSVHDPASVEALRDRLFDALWGADTAPWIGLARHRARAEEALDAMVEAQGALDRGLDHLEIAALPLMIAWSRLGEIVGAHSLGAVGDEVLDQIFSRFCIGK